MIKKKNTKRLKTLPKGARLPSTALSSAIKLLIMKVKFIISWFEAAQNGDGRNKNKRPADTQFPANGKNTIMLGSKIEKRFPIG